MKKRENGNAAIIAAIFMIMVLLLFFVYSFRMSTIRYEIEYVDNGLSAAILASAYLNLEEYGTSNQVIIHESDVGKDLVGNATEETYAARENNLMQDKYLTECYEIFANCLGYNLRLQTYNAGTIKTDFIPENQNILRGASGEINSKIRVLEYIVYNVYIDPIKRPATEEELLAAGLSNAPDADTETPNDAYVDDSMQNVEEVATNNGMVAINGIYYVVDGYIKTIYEYEYDISSDGVLLNIRLTDKKQCISATSDAALTYDMGVVTPAGEPVLYSTIYASIGFCVVPFPDIEDDSQSITFYKEKHRAVEVQTVIGTT